jgi:hypothetical protein
MEKPAQRFKFNTLTNKSSTKGKGPTLEVFDPIPLERQMRQRVQLRPRGANQRS